MLISKVWVVDRNVVVWLVGKTTCPHTSQTIYCTHTHEISHQFAWEGVEFCGKSCKKRKLGVELWRCRWYQSLVDKLIGTLGCTQEHKFRILNKIANIIITDLYLITGIQSSTHKITLHYTWKGLEFVGSPKRRDV